jgi:hypothetical protein
MSTVDAELEIASRPVNNADGLTQAREAQVGDMTVRRLLPLRLPAPALDVARLVRRR